MAAFSTEDLSRIKRAIALGALVVRYDDGRQVTYRSIEELMQAKAAIEAELVGRSPVRKVMAHTKGTTPPAGDNDWGRA